MAENGWTWADLNADQMKLMAEAEATLGADYLLAYRQSDEDTPRSIRFALLELEAAGLNDSQLECLAGLEQQLGVVVVAYKIGKPLEM